MNKVILMGRLTRDPEMRGEDTKKLARFTLAVDRRNRREGDQTADFISCVAFGKTAEFLEKYVRQGTKLNVCGRIQTGSYTGREGNKVYTTDVVVEEVEFAESKGAGNGAHAQAAAPQPQPQPQAIPGAAPMPQVQMPPQGGYYQQPAPQAAPQPAIGTQIQPANGAAWMNIGDANTPFNQ